MALAHLAILEYFAGLELLRPVLLWVLRCSHNEAGRGQSEFERILIGMAALPGRDHRAMLPGGCFFVACAS